MVADIDATIAELNGTYRPAINAATTKQQLLDACQSVFIDLRIFMVFIPQVEYLAAIESMQNGELLLQARVDQLNAAGVDTSAMQARLDEASDALTLAQTKTLSVTVAGYNADPVGTRAVWAEVRSQVTVAFVDLVSVLRALEPLTSIGA